MTPEQLIQWARKEWCERPVAGEIKGHPTVDRIFYGALRPCPPEVVAALLDVLSDYCARNEHLPLSTLAAIEKEAQK